MCKRSKRLVSTWSLSEAQEKIGVHFYKLIDIGVKNRVRVKVRRSKNRIKWNGEATREV